MRGSFRTALLLALLGGFVRTIPAQDAIPPLVFNEYRFINDGFSGPDVICSPEPIQAVSQADMPAQSFVARCGGHEIQGTVQVNAPPVLPAATFQPDANPLTPWQLNEPVHVTAEVQLTWQFGGLGPGDLDAHLDIGFGVDAEFHPLCSNETEIDVSEGETQANATVRTECDVTAVALATGEEGLPAGSVYFPVFFVYTWYPDLFRDPRPPSVGGALSPVALYGGQTDAPTVDLSFAGLEIVQAVQTAPPSFEPANADPERRMPLIEDKAAMLRAYVRGAEDLEEGVFIRLEARRNGVELSRSPLTVGPFPVGPPDRSRPEGSVNIRLPSSWTAEGTVELTAEVFPPDGVVDTDDENNEAVELFQFSPGVLFFDEALQIYYVPFCYQPGASGPTHCPDDNTEGPGASRLPVSGFADLTARVLPLSDYSIVYRPLPVAALKTTIPLRRRNRGLVLSIARRYYENMDHARRRDIDQLVFWVPPEVTNATGGLLGVADAWWASIPGTGRVSWSANNSQSDPSDPQRTLVHELSHNLGLRHTNTQNGCGSRDSNTDWPRRGTREGGAWNPPGDSRIGEVGFDPLNGEFKPSGLMDYMSYCTPSSRPPNNQEVWISPYHYKKLFENCFENFAGDLSLDCLFGDRIDFGRDGAAIAPVAQITPAPYLVVSGSIQADGSSANLDPVLQLVSSTPPAPIGPPGGHCLVVSGDAGPLAEHCFSVDFLDPETREPVDEAFFAMRVPAPAGATRLALTDEGRELTSVEASPNAPQVNITSPQPGDRWEGGTETVRWDASDPDGEPVIFGVHYSPDGGDTWFPLQIDIKATQLEVDPSQIEGGDNVLVRVLASDGFNTTEERAGPIQVVQNPRLEAPDRLLLHDALIAQAVERTLTLRNTGSGPLEITSIGASSDVLVPVTPAPVILGAGESRAVLLRFTPPTAGLHTGTVLLETSDPAQPSVEIPFEGNGVTVARPNLAAVSPRLDFGEVSVGATATRAVRLENLGSAAATIEAIESSGAPFALAASPTPYEVGIGASSISVTFTPIAAGPSQGQLTIRSTASVIEIELSGTGIETAGPGGVRPSINSGGVVDAASFRAILSPGGIGSIFGLDLAPATTLASQTPLPLEMNGVRVRVNGLWAPLFFVSEGQINFQIPFEVSTTSQQANVVVERDGVASPPVTAEMAANAPAVFMNTAIGAPIVQRHPSLDLITPDNPARPGDVLILFLTGIGELIHAPQTGSPAATNPLAAAVETPTVTIGGIPVPVFFAGLAPGFVGLGQLNVQMPESLPLAASTSAQTASTMPLVIRFGESESQPVNLPVASNASNAANVSFELVDVLPRLAVLQDRLVVRFDVRKPEGVAGTANGQFYLSPDAAVDPDSDFLLGDFSLDLSDTGDQRFQASGIALPDDLTPTTYFVGLQVEFLGDVHPVSSLPFDLVEQRQPFDLSVEIEQVEPSQAGPGEALTVFYSLFGADSLTGTFERSLYLSSDSTITSDDTLINTRTADIIEGSNSLVSRNNMIPDSTLPGDYFIGLVLESSGDTNPANNVSEALPIPIVSQTSAIKTALPAEIGPPDDILPEEPFKIRPR